MQFIFGGIKQVIVHLGSQIHQPWTKLKFHGGVTQLAIYVQLQSAESLLYLTSWRNYGMYNSTLTFSTWIYCIAMYDLFCTIASQLAMYNYTLHKEVPSTWLHPTSWWNYDEYTTLFPPLYLNQFTNWTTKYIFSLQCTGRLGVLFAFLVAFSEYRST